MTKDASKTLVALEGGLYTAPVDTAAPADVNVDPSGTWTELGWLQVDGPVLSDQKTFTDIRGWPGNEIIRTLLDERTVGITGELLQVFDQAAWLLLMGGGTFTAGKWEPATGTDYTQAVILDVIDGTNRIRFHAHSAKNVANTELGMPSNDLAGGAVELRFQKSGTNPLFTVESNIW